MEPRILTVTAINGDYAEMVSDAGGDNTVAMFLLPGGVTVGTRLKRENFEWFICQEGQ